MPPDNHSLYGRGANNAKRTKLQAGMDNLGTDFAPGQLDSLLSGSVGALEQGL